MGLEAFAILVAHVIADSQVAADTATVLAKTKVVVSSYETSSMKT